MSRSLKFKSVKKTIDTRDGSVINYAEFFAAQSKSIIDEIDTVLVQHYGFTPQNLDFIVSYDIKYRMGQDGSGKEED